MPSVPVKEVKAMPFERLFESVRIGTMELKNRIVMAPMGTNLAGDFGSVTDRLIDYYVERAKGGVSLVIVENTPVEWPRGKAIPISLRIDNDKFVAGLNELVEAVHLAGAKICLQLQHAGAQGSMGYSTEGARVVAPSDVPCLATGGEIPRPLTIEEIDEIEEKFALGAKRCKAAGFDAVEIHGAHGYLLMQFMSPFYNRRGDSYGGTFENRMRFPVEIVKRVRAAVGDDYPVIYRISADEHIDGGLTLKESKRAVALLQQAGADSFHVSAGVYDSVHMMMPGMGAPDGIHMELVRGIKSAVDVPVIGGTKLRTAALAEQVIKDGKADLVAFGRPLIADPEMPKKIAEGRVEDICPCIYCNECAGRIHRDLRIGCYVNASVGKEKEYRLKPTDRTKHVMVVGGGPAGMEAARVAALRGHKVTLYEKTRRLGGACTYASAAAFKTEIQDLIKYFETQLQKLAIVVELGREVTAELVDQVRPDVVIVATGAMPFIPDIPGIKRPNVALAEDVLVGAVEVGAKAVVMGGGRIGCEVARFLREKGKNVTIVTRQSELATDMTPESRLPVLRKLAELRIEVLTNRKLDEVTDSGVVVTDRNWEKQSIEADNVVLALGQTPRTELRRELEGRVPELCAIGDCVQPGRIFEAIHQAARVAREI